MVVQKRIIRKASVIGTICIIAIFFMMPQFFMTAHGETDIPMTRESSGNDVGKAQWNITEGGNYVFTGSTTKNHIRIYSPDNVPYNEVTITLDNVTIDLQAGNEHPAIDIQEETNVTIILKGTNYLHGGKRDKLLYTDDGYAGIRVHNTSEVTIIGEGSLEAVGWLGRRGAAGIGGGNAIGTGGGGAIHDLKITGGTIKAYGGGATMDENGKVVSGDTCGAGIGGSDKGDVSGLETNETTENTLNITAIGGDRGAGIGNANSGEAGNDGMIQNDIGSINITLNGGTINATGGYGGAGIGGGNSKADNIEIYGNGTINATGGDHSSAIGAGKKEDGGDITIKGSDGGRNLIIYGYATKSNGDNDAAVIGGADSEGGDITISNAKLYLDSPYNCSGAAIGSGSNASMIADDMGDITITNCYVEDKSYADRTAASIGAGFNSLVNSITIKNSEVKGGAIGGTDNGNRVFEDPCIESITIADSSIIADNRHGQRAAIGSGRFEGIESITITNSTVTASTVSGAGIGTGGYSSDNVGDGLKWTGNACGSITIEDSNVAAQGKDGGAGIGGGWGTPVGKVKITDSTVTASSGNRGDHQGGTGIGGGWCESTDDITISGSKVTATAAGHSAGIGCSGSDTSSAVMWNATCNSISIKNGSEVTATGGSGAAGIGTGYGAQYGSYARITISDSTVTAQGGDYGAGIGAGRNGYLGAGGESDDIDITGTSKVTAKGGVGGAGIGGGYDGGADPVTIDLTETVREGDDWKYYVKAYGGKGAAGIGSGGVYVDPDDKFHTAQHGHDIDRVSVSGGYVYAKGGDDENGAGAGIGGGARGGNLNTFKVSGGFIEAAAGYGYSSYDKADDIGTGGEDNRDAIDNDFIITGGTVLGGA